VAHYPKTIRKIIGAAALLLLPTMSVQADAPPSPAGAIFYSTNQMYCGQYDAAKNLTRITPMKKGATTKAWSIAGRVAVAMIANDGTSVAKLPATANLLPPGSKPETVVLSFYAPGKVPVIVMLKQVIAKPAALARTTSNIHWASSYGYAADGMFELNTEEKVTFRIDPATGRAVNRKYY
jgi:hypothetical protein